MRHVTINQIVEASVSEVRSGAGGGKLPRERASLKIRVSVVRIGPWAPFLRPLFQWLNVAERRPTAAELSVGNKLGNSGEFAG